MEKGKTTKSTAVLIASAYGMTCRSGKSSLDLIDRNNTVQ
jgi:hypothetical protein